MPPREATKQRESRRWKRTRRGILPWEIRRERQRQRQLSDDEPGEKMRSVARDAARRESFSLRSFLIPHAIREDSLWRVMKVQESRNPIFRSRSIYLFLSHARFRAQYSSRWALELRALYRFLTKERSSPCQCLSDFLIFFLSRRAVPINPN